MNHPTMFVLLVAMLALATTAPAAAQPSDPAPPDDTDSTRVGVGVDLGVDPSVPVVSGVTAGLGSISYTRPIVGGIRIPIDLRGDWNVEPRLTGGYTRSSSPTTVGGNLDGEESREATRISRSYNLGITAQVRRHWDVGESVSGFVGFEAGGLVAHAEEDIRPEPEQGQAGAGLGSDDGTSYGALFAPVLGGEYFLAPSMSLGIEAKLSGAYSTNPSVEGSERGTSFDLSPAGAVVFRAYF